MERSDLKYDKTFIPRVRDLCYLGAKTAEIADLLGVTVSTLRKWRDQHPEFDDAWRDGAQHADAMVAAALYKRACGYSTRKWKETKDGMFQEQVHVAADVGACVFWLTNRQPDLWKNKVEHEAVNSANMLGNDVSDMELARRLIYIITNSAHNVIDGEAKRIENGSLRPVPPETK